MAPLETARYPSRVGAAVGIAALAVTACAPADMPELPLRMHFADDVSAEDRAAYRAGAAEWNAAVGDTVVREVDSLEGCGLYVVRGDDLAGSKLAGAIRMTSSCKLVTRLNPGRGAAVMTSDALHELGHGLLTASDADHTDDEGSYMFHVYRPGQSITDSDVEAVRARLGS